MDKETLKQRALERREGYFRGQRRWTVAHHVAIFGSILCSIVAGALLQFANVNGMSVPPKTEISAAQPEPEIRNIQAPSGIPLHRSWRTGCATIFTSLAAALTAISASGDFYRKWRSNRISRSQVDALLLDIDGENPDVPALTSQLKEIILKHDLEVVSEK